jgi:hypothetical protein
MASRYNGASSNYSSNTARSTLESNGWQHTGSNNQARVEFYQRGDVKMDYYPTTGTVKTSMDHPVQGHTQMFRRDLSSSQFSAVASNPRAHTGHGYQHKY